MVFQWRPESNAVAFVNVFDKLHELGKDDWLAQAKQTPPPRPFDDAGKSWDAVVRSHLAVLDGYPAIKAKYMAAVGDPVQANGLPQSGVVDEGNAYVLRAQRVVFQEWKQDVPWAKAGQVTVALGGDIAKEAGILPDANALQPVAAPPGSSASSGAAAASPPPSSAAAPSSAPAASAGKVIVLDPGHGAYETGAARSAGPRLVEKDVVLDVGLRLADLLRAAGFTVVMTRDADTRVDKDERDLNGDGKADEDDDLQARVDVSNDANADMFLSLHANGGTPDMRGLSTFYCASCPNAATSRRFAAALHKSVLAAIAPFGATEFGAGLYDEAGLGKPYGHLFVIGPKTPRVARPNKAPAQALIEMLFISNSQDAALLARGDVRDALAQALRDGIQAFVK